MPSALSKSEYTNLLGHVSRIYDEAQEKARDVLNHLKAEAYWQIGRQIVKVEQNNRIMAAYGERLLERLSNDLARCYGSGFSLTNLKYMRQFYLSKGIGHARDQLGWTNIRALISIKDAGVREEYASKTINNKWSTRQLRNALKEHKIKTRSLAAPISAHQACPMAKLLVRRGTLNTCRLVLSPINGRAMIDLGFESYKPVNAAEIGTMKEGDIVTIQEERNTIRIEPSRVARGNIYTYKAFVVRVVDGDTLVCEVETGAGFILRKRLRLKSINAAELSSQRGKKRKRPLKAS
ncbi:MAG: hypothetical protein KAS66_03780 [Candidatus Omnitrophica bacterium]|nr:hypothetical protein [Candidatus Omnitrophota bacterium]